MTLTERSARDLEARVKVDVQHRCRCEIGVAGSTDSEGNVTVNENENPWRTEATRRHEAVHKATQEWGKARFGSTEDPRFKRWWNNPRNWAADEIKAYATEILYM